MRWSGGRTVMTLVWKSCSDNNKGEGSGDMRRKKKKIDGGKILIDMLIILIFFII